MLNEWQCSSDLSVGFMGLSMKSKFEKYQGDPQKMNTLIFLANNFDSQDKLEYMEFSLKQMYGDDTGLTIYLILKFDLYTLFDEYVLEYSNISSGSNSEPTVSADPSDLNMPVKSMSLLKVKFKMHKMEIGGSLANKKLELDIYLSEDIVEEDDSFNVLRWWKVNSERFSILSRMACVVLVVPILTVASESTFSTGGRVLDVFRSCLTPKIVQVLICTSDWLKMTNKPILAEKTLDDMEKLEREVNIHLNQLFPFHLYCVL